MKKVAGKEVSKEVSKKVSKVTYSIEDMNQVLGFLSQQKYSEVTGLVELLKTKGELS